MLINTCQDSYLTWNNNKKSKLSEKYGQIMDIKIPILNSEISKIDINMMAQELFSKITASFDYCSNSPKIDAVLIEESTELTKALKAMLILSEIKCINNPNI